MINVQQIHDLPNNLDSFVDEIGTALGALYGPAANAAYRNAAKASYSHLICHPDVRFWASDSPETTGLVIGVIRRGIAYITMLHILAGQNGNGIEKVLLDAATEDLRGQGVRGIIGEFVRYRRLDIEEPLTRLGYSKYDRRLMIADLADERLALDSPAVTSPCEDRDTLAAEVLVDAYKGHASHPLHPETHDEESAAAFLKTFRAGGLGATTPPFYRVYMSDGVCQGMIMGAEAAPDIGFILHVASARSAQGRGRGIGTHLILELAAAFRDGGYTRMALGVTCGNPAERLYERLGFDHLMPVDTYAWWAEPPIQADMVESHLAKPVRTRGI